jgi:NADPH2:quinone reductase
MQAIVIDPQAPQRLALRMVEQPILQANEALVRVKAISLNRSEVLTLPLREPEGTRLGWDLAGIVEQPAASGSGPIKGSRVVGLAARDGWAELVAIPTHALAQLPPSVSFAQAATLPVAGLTALRVLERERNLLARSVLIIGASGGVGMLACQLASLAGAYVVGQVRQATAVPLAHESGADQVVVDSNIKAAAPFGPYHLIMDQVGGQTLADAMTMLAPGGICVSIGITGRESMKVPLDLGQVYQTGKDRHLRLDFMYLFSELEQEPASLGLERLVRLVNTGQLNPHIGIEADWQEVNTVAQALIERQFLGKAVLHLPD